VIECVVNLAEGREHAVITTLGSVCGDALLDVHTDVDHHRSVFTLAGPGAHDADPAARRLALAAADLLDLEGHDGAHPRLGVIDVVPFVALTGTAAERAEAVEVATGFGEWIAAELDVPAFLYDEADPQRRPLPETRRDAFVKRPPDFGPARPHFRLGATAVGARPPLVAVNCELDCDDLPLARRIAAAVRERDGGLPGVRALGIALLSRRVVQVSMNLVRLEQTSIEAACTEVHRLARDAGADVRVELVGLLPAAELARCGAAFLAWTGLGNERTIEARLARAAAGEGGSGAGTGAGAPV
jgi:glutamate formiminotransferase / 5-formyltetrahydrofolate cyclo-ligase